MVYDGDLHQCFAAKTFQDEVFGRTSSIANRFTREALSWENLDIHPNVVLRPEWCRLMTVSHLYREALECFEEAQRLGVTQAATECAGRCFVG